MLLQRRVSAFSISCALLAIMLLGHASGLHAQPISPAAVEPERETTVVREPDDESIIRVPLPQQRSATIHAGPAIEVQSFVLVYDDASLIAGEVKDSTQSVVDEYLRQTPALTFGQMEEVAQQATQHLRNEGYILARVILPPQEIERGAVQLHVLAGTLGGINTQDNQLYTSRSLVYPLRDNLDRAVELSRLESELLRINDLPGLGAVAVFKPGIETGETDLTIRTVEEDPAAYHLRVDNYGVESTGDIRLLAGIEVNNMTSYRDRLAVDVVKTFNPGDLRNARVNYEVTLPELLHTLGLAYSETRYDVEGSEFKALNLEGDTEIADIYLRSAWVRQRNFNFSTQLGLSTKRAELDASGASSGVDRLTVAMLGLVVDQVDTRFRGLHRATLTFYRGLNDFIGSMDEQGNNNSLALIDGEQKLPGEFEKISVTYNRLQSLTRNHSLLLRLAGQYSSDQLASLEKMSLGGPYTVRAYPVGEFVNDRAVFASLAWSINAGFFSDAIVYGEQSWSDVLTVSLFADYGWGKNIENNGSITRREIDGWGIDFNFRFPDPNFYVDFAAARPFGDDEAINGDDTQYWFSLGLKL